MSKNYHLLIILCVFLNISGCSENANKGASKSNVTPTLKPTVEESIDHLHQVFMENSLRANSLYELQPLFLTGLIHDIGETNYKNKNPKVTLVKAGAKGSEVFREIYLHHLVQTDIMKLSKGQTIKVFCVGAKSSTSGSMIDLYHCELIEINPKSAINNSSAILLPQEGSPLTEGDQFSGTQSSHSSHATGSTSNTNSEVTKVRAGELRIAYENFIPTLLFNGRKIEIETDFQFLGFSGLHTHKFVVGDHDVVLVDASVNASCQSYFFVTIANTPTVSVKSTPSFGTCNDSLQVTQNDKLIILTMNDANGNTQKFVYDNGIVKNTMSTQN